MVRATELVGGRSPGEPVAIPPHRCVLHSQLSASNGPTMIDVLIMVPNILLISFWRLEPTATEFQNMPVCTVTRNCI